jgi:hypothetical protein
MKAIGITSTALLALLLAVAAPGWAQEQHEQEQKGKPAQAEEKKVQPEKSVKQEQKPAAKEEKTAKPVEKTASPVEKSAKPEEKNAQQHAVQAQPALQQQKAAGKRIPDDRYKASFGQQHRFRVSQSDGRNRHFQYGGYSFGFAEPWPTNWLYTQDVYVIEIDGVYYLCNAMYPGVNIELSIVL